MADQDASCGPAPGSWHRLCPLLAALLVLPCTSCVFARMVYYNAPSLAAPTYFDNRLAHASLRPVPFERGPNEASFPMRRSRTRSYRTFDELIAQNDTRAFLVLHHDKIVYERYFGDVTPETLLPCFSMSKTFAAVLVGCVERDGLIPSVQQHLVDVVPDLADKPGYEGITIEHLLRMTSGIDFKEESVAGAEFFYATDLRDLARAYDVKWKPGEHYQYGSVNIQLLWEVLQRRIGERTITGYFEERLWDAIGAERAAAWALDSERSGVEKLSAGLSATTRDYARLGVLFQHRGRIGGRPVISEQWVVDSLALDDVSGEVRTVDGVVRRGRYQWFWTRDGCCYFAKGYHGQYVFVDRDRDVVVVRFGEGYGKVDWTTLFTQVAESL